jgi:hypothetical protein
VNDNIWNLDEETRNDLRVLLATLKEFSGYTLTDCPVFKPFGAFLDAATGAPGVVVAQLEGTPGLTEYRDALLRGFRGQVERGESRAAGYCELGRAVPPDATEDVPVVLVRMEHRSGLSVRVSVPYVVEGREKVTFGESFLCRDESRIFSTPGQAQKPASDD